MTTGDLYTPPIAAGYLTDTRTEREKPLGHYTLYLAEEVLDDALPLTAMPVLFDFPELHFPSDTPDACILFLFHSNKSK